MVRLGRGFVEIKAEGEEISAGAGALDLNVALSACAAGIAGLEFLSGIPGTIGGGLRMNAGAYGSEFKDVLVAAKALDARGRLHEMTPADMGLSYRHCGVAGDWMFVAARFKGEARRAQGDRRAHGHDPDAARGKPADPRPHRRLDLRQPAGTQGLAADRPGRLPRPETRRRDGFGQAHAIS